MKVEERAKKQNIGQTSNIRQTSRQIFNTRNYRNDPKFSDRLIWANSADPDQTAPRGAV